MNKLYREEGFLKLVKDLLDNGERLDKRKMDEMRKIVVVDNFLKNSEGSCYVELGDTKVFASVKFSIGKTFSDEEGNLITNLEIQRNFTQEDIENRDIEYSRVVDRIIRQSRFIDAKKLKVDDENSWTIFLDIYVLNDDGNIIDASTLASVRALLNARLPQYEKKGDEYEIKYDKITDQKLPLNKENIPLSFTFAKYKDKIILDPNKYEEEISDSLIVIGVSKTINGIQTIKNKGLDVEEIYNMSLIAKNKRNELLNLLKW